MTLKKKKRATKRMSRNLLFAKRVSKRTEVKSSQEMVPGASGAYLTLFQYFGGHHVDSVKTAVLPMYRNDDSV